MPAQALRDGWVSIGRWCNTVQCKRLFPYRNLAVQQSGTFTTTRHVYNCITCHPDGANPARMEYEGTGRLA